MAGRGRPCAPVRISNNVVPRNNLDTFGITPRAIYNSMRGPMVWLRWLADHRMIRNSNDCNNCQRAMSLVRHARACEGYLWRCNPCNTRRSIRTGSFFTESRIHTHKIVMMLFYWVHEVKAKNVMLFEGIRFYSTIVDWNNYFRTECCNWLQDQQVQLGGFDATGHPIYVEVDETYFFHRKYHCGHYRTGTWVVGLVERNTQRCWLQIVERRDAQTLEGIITAHVLPGSIIITDAWAGYANVSQINNGVYQHDVVHGENCVHPDHPDIHTQTIEGLWMHAKRQLRYQSGTSRNLFPSYLSAFQWRFSHRENVFGQYLQLLSVNYNI